jgi:oligosaccharide repeat unit polymerase
MTPERYVAAGAAVILAVGAWLATRLARRRMGSAIEPLGVFLFAWSVALGLFAIPWVKFTTSSVTAWLAIYAAILAFAGGCLVAYRLPMKGRPPNVEVERVDPRRLQIVLSVCLVMAWIGFAAFLHAVNDVIGWSKVFTDPQLVRTIQTTSTQFQSAYGPWKLLTYFGGIGFLLWTVGLRLRAFRGGASPLVVLGALSVVPYLFTTDRAQFVTTVVWTGLFHLVWRPVTQLRRAALILVAIGIVTLAGFMIIGSRRGTSIRNFPDIKRTLATQSLNSLVLPYLYLASDVPIFTQLLRDPNRPHTYGALTFRPVVKLASLAHLAGSPPSQFSSFYPVPFADENVASWLAPFYLDYGLAGCVLVPLLLGAGSASVAKFALSRRTLLTAWLLATVLLVAAATPVADKFSDPITWELVAAGLILGPILTGSSPRAFLYRARRPGTWTSKSGLIVGSLILALLAIPAVVAVVATRARPPDPANVAELRTVLRTAAAKAERADHRFGPQGSLALVSQLRLSSPNVNYTQLGSGAPPPVAGTVGVLSTRSATTFRVRSSRGQTIEITWITDGRGQGLYGPVVTRSEGLIVNGGFEPPLNDWSERLGPVANFGLDRRVRRFGLTSLRVTGTGVVGGPTALSQEVLDLPSKAAGSFYRLRLSYRTRRLSRSLAVEVELIYANGSYHFFPGYSLGAHPSIGIAKGTSRGWRLLEADAIARSRLAAIQVFAVDTGTAKLTGRAWIDGASLQRVG